MYISDLRSHLCRTTYKIVVRSASVHKHKFKERSQSGAVTGLLMPLIREECGVAAKKTYQKMLAELTGVGVKRNILVFLR